MLEIIRYQVINTAGNIIVYFKLNNELNQRYFIDVDEIITWQNTYNTVINKIESAPVIGETIKIVRAYTKSRIKLKKD